MPMVWLNQATRQERLRLYQAEGIELDSRDRIINFKEKLLDLSWPNFDDLDA